MQDRKYPYAAPAAHIRGVLGYFRKQGRGLSLLSSAKTMAQSLPPADIANSSTSLAGIQSITLDNPDALETGWGYQA